MSVLGGGAPNLRFGLAMILALLAAGCSVGTPTAAPGPELVKIGLVVSLSGSNTSGAEPAIQGANVAAADINARGGLIGRNLQLLQRDDRSDPTTAQIVCARLVQQDGVSAIVGSQSPAGRAACSRSAQQAGVPYLALGLSDGSECFANGYFLGLSPSQRTAALVSFLMTTKSARRFFVVSSDSKAGRGLADEMTHVILAAGGLSVGTGITVGGADRFDGLLATIGQQKPDAVIDALTGSSAIAFHRQFASALPTRSIVQASLQMAETETSIVGTGFTEQYLATDYLPGDPASANKDWLSAVETRYGDGAVPTALAAEAYDSVELTALAIAKAKEAAGANVNANLAEVTLDGPRGMVRFELGNHGYATLAAHIGKLAKNGVVDQVAVSPPLEPAVSCA